MKVLWEEPLKTMRTINVTLGRLHFRGIDLPLELTEQRGSRADSESRRRTHGGHKDEAGWPRESYVSLYLMYLSCLFKGFEKSQKK